MMSEIIWIPDHEKWDEAVGTQQSIDFGAAGLDGPGIWSPMGGTWETSAGVQFSCRRCIGIIPRTYHPTYDFAFSASMEGSTALREHAVGPGGPLRATLGVQANAVGVWVFTVAPNAEAVLARVACGGVEHERELQTFDPPQAAFIGVVADGPVEWVEFDLAPGATNDYACIAKLCYGSAP